MATREDQVEVITTLNDDVLAQILAQLMGLDAINGVIAMGKSRYKNDAMWRAICAAKQWTADPITGSPGGPQGTPPFGGSWFAHFKRWCGWIHSISHVIEEYDNGTRYCGYNFDIGTLLTMLRPWHYRTFAFARELVIIDGRLLRNLSHELQKNRGIVRHAIQQNGFMILYLQPQFQNDRDIAAMAVKRGRQERRT
jgi:hypothetical protein